MRYGRVAFLVAVLLLLCHVPTRGNAKHRAAHRRLDQTQFRSLLETVSRGWNSNDARLAAECFTEDAIYSAPPDSRVRRGRRELFDFFGGEKGRDQPMHMEWHHLMFDEKEQIGAGEYTFTYQIRTHGVAVVRIVDGRIANWREYEQQSALDWDKFIEDNRF